MAWLPLNLENIPGCSGVYGWKSEEGWLYIGQSKNLSKRLTSQHPPLKIAVSLESAISYWYIPCERPRRLERQLHQKLQPSWCGGLDIFAKHPSCAWDKQLISPSEVEDAISLL